MFEILGVTMQYSSSRLRTQLYHGYLDNFSDDWLDAENNHRPHNEYLVRCPVSRAAEEQGV